VSSKDEHHARVVDVFQTFQNVRLRSHIVTTNHVVAETIALTRKFGHDQATRLDDQLYGEKLASIHWTTQVRESRQKDGPFRKIEVLHGPRDGKQGRRYPHMTGPTSGFGV
jgi:predicted nucleic acid-binding protein